ncbi:MAG: sugar phosphate isomerase/epimerase family protein [bacterium]
MKSTASLTTGLLMRPLEAFAQDKPALAVPKDFAVKIMATNWGFEGGWEDFCKKVKEAGYDGVEVWLPGKENERQEMLRAVKKYGLQLGFLAAGWQSDFKEHLTVFQKNLEDCVKHQPLYINCHSGRDYFTFEQNKQFIEATIKAAQASGIPIFHETHRSRICYSAPVTRKFLEEIPAMRLNVDLSHWCTVHESLLQDQQETVKLALNRADHIHARIGHQEGPQVNDPRAPEWSEAVKQHFAWWDEVVRNKIKAGAKYLTVLTEFGPPNYLPALPYTRLPVANQWEINVHMQELLRQRYS